MTATKTQDRSRRYTKEEAQLAGWIPPHHAWDEHLQEAIPVGMAIHRDRIREEAESGIDEEKALKAFAKTRDATLKFVASQLVEAEYYPETHSDRYKRGMPVPGKMHDYYRLPGYAAKVLTKQGSEKVAQFFGLKRVEASTTIVECTKESVIVTARVRFTNRWGDVAAASEGAASSAESSFRFAAGKYGQRKDRESKAVTEEADFRAALNDVTARAVKRASTAAIVFATATDDIFDTGTVERKAEASGIEDHGAARTEAPRFPNDPKIFKDLAGEPLTKATPAQLTGILKWCKDPARKNPQALMGLIDALSDELDRRRDQSEDEPAV